MGYFSTVDPNFVQEQKRFFLLRALVTTKNATAISTKKALLFVLPVLEIALAVVFVFSGIFDKGYIVCVNDEIYRITDNIVYELPEGYAFVGSIVYSDEPKEASDRFASNWTLDASIYVNPSENETAYITAYGGYLEIDRK